MGLWILAEKSVICATALMVSAALAAPQATFYVSPGNLLRVPFGQRCRGRY